MQCDETRKLLVEYSEGALADLERRAVDRHLEQCSECNALLSEIWEFSLMATDWQEQPVPRWNRRTALVGASSPGVPWLNLVSLAASLLVLLVLVLRVEVRITEAGTRIAFGGPQETVTSAELDQRLEARDKQIQGLLTDNLQTLTAQQLAANQLLLRSVLDVSRQERREDLVSVMSVWATDRQRMERATGESLDYLIRNQVAGQRELQQISSVLRELDLREDNHL